MVAVCFCAVTDGLIRENASSSTVREEIGCCCVTSAGFELNAINRFKSLISSSSQCVSVNTNGLRHTSSIMMGNRGDRGGT